MGVSRKVASLDPWRVLSTAVVLDSPWLQVRVDECITEAGHVVEPYFVLELPDWVHIVALDDSGAVLVIRQYRHGAKIVSAEFPAGSVEAGDRSASEAAQRELLEETGYVAGRWDLIGSTFANPANQTNRIHAFLARDLRYVAGEAGRPDEVVSWEFLSWSEVMDLADAGIFGQALHQATMFNVLRGLGRIEMA